MLFFTPPPNTPSFSTPTNPLAPHCKFRVAPRAPFVRTIFDVKSPTNILSSGTGDGAGSDIEGCGDDGSRIGSGEERNRRVAVVVVEKSADPSLKNPKKYCIVVNTSKNGEGFPFKMNTQERIFIP